MSEPQATPFDAVLVAPGVIQHSVFSNVLHAACDLGEPLIGKPCYVRSIGGGRLFLSQKPSDALGFPDGHAQAREPRYTWADHTLAGVQVGKYVEAALVK